MRSDGAGPNTTDGLRETVEALNIASAEQKTKGHGPLREALWLSAPHLQYLGLQPSRVDRPLCLGPRRRSAPFVCLRAKILERLAWDLSPHTRTTCKGLETPAFAQTCETCETWPELVLKLVGICVKLVKLVKLGRKISKGSALAIFRASTVPLGFPLSQQTISPLEPSVTSLRGCGSTPGQALSLELEDAEQRMANTMTWSTGAPGPTRCLVASCLGRQGCGVVFRRFRGGGGGGAGFGPRHVFFFVPHCLGVRDFLVTFSGLGGHLSGIQLAILEPPVAIVSMEPPVN